MNKTCNTCQHRNEHGVCTNEESVYFGSRVDDGTCPVWENYDEEMWGGRMMEYISKRAAAEVVCDVVCGKEKGLCVCAPGQCQQGHMKRLYDMPAADVAPVVHAKWENNKDEYPECTNCRYMPAYDPAFDDIYYSTYCPNCGAKMDG